jgi:hypothetical protein
MICETCGKEYKSPKCYNLHMARHYHESHSNEPHVPMPKPFSRLGNIYRARERVK